MAKLPQGWKTTWDGLHVSPWTAYSKANLCTHHHWFGRQSESCFEPYHEMPMSITRLWAMVQIRVGSHALLIEQGRFVRPSLPRHLQGGGEGRGRKRSAAAIVLSQEGLLGLFRVKHQLP